MSHFSYDVVEEDKGCIGQGSETVYWVYWGVRGGGILVNQSRLVGGAPSLGWVSYCRLVAAWV